jgi:perosamine synthetase
MTTGEGGMVATNNDQIAKLCKSMRNQGRDEGMKWLMHNRLGYNYRLSDINCALGIVQLSRISELLRKREQVAALYRQYLSDIEEIVLPSYSDSEATRSWFIYVVLLKEGFSAKQRNGIIEKLRERGIGCNSYFPPIYLQPFYKDMFRYRRGAFPVTDSVSDRTIAIPFYNNLSAKEIRSVAKELKTAIKGKG